MTIILIKKELLKEFDKQFTRFRENAEKYITFSVPIKKEVKRIDKYGKEKTEIICCNIKFAEREIW